MVVGIIILLLVLVATGLAVAFATRGALAGTAHISSMCCILWGRRIATIAREFQLHFLRLGLKGGLIGGVLAVLFFASIGLVSGRFGQGPGLEQVEALFGRFSLPLGGYLSVMAIGVIVSGVTALVSRITVFRTLTPGARNERGRARRFSGGWGWGSPAG